MIVDRMVSLFHCFIAKLLNYWVCMECFKINPSLRVTSDE